MILFQKLEYLVLLSLLTLSGGEFVIPDATLQAYRPKGFAVSIKAEPGIEFFAFHGKKGSPIELLEPGEFQGDVTHPMDGYFTYYNDELSLKPGDKIYYWLMVQHEQLRYRKQNQEWEIRELFDINAKCLSSSGVECSTILNDNFDDNDLNYMNWIWEQYIPNEPDFEFANYKKDKKVTFLQNGLLHMKPKLVESESELSRTVDLTDGCTRSETIFCWQPYEVFYQNPFTSGRIESKKHFSFSRVEISAKLPKGDWIYPQIFLEDVNNSTRKIWIAYSRGNPSLTGNDGQDIGAKILFGGPVLDPKEPGRSAHLTSTRGTEPFYNTFRKYTIEWNTDGLLFSVDGLQYGYLNSNVLKTLGIKQPLLVKLVIGIGVGGITDFPDGYTSGTYEKPWRNGERLQIKNFYRAKDKWIKSWDDNSELVIDYVKVTKLL